ncbi:uncharacterized protein LOC131060775 isoform X2 [Cryptomeria japonica]|uniref:uncharacterized protein LOC131060775 isoform X2 n=1 Tax=Cryptomeria japonica TaxID=3369 RepID=UPI0025AD8DED|nr:uncharacterized protein LOC131060775 isoform X2 [Cryptomeria japonica]
MCYILFKENSRHCLIIFNLPFDLQGYRAEKKCLLRATRLSALLKKLQRLRHRLEVSFDSTRTDHQEGLKELWHAAFPGLEFSGLISEQWKEMGWQGTDPSTDFRGGGLISLENLVFLSKTYPRSFQRLLQKQAGDRSAWEYPFAIAGVNITFMLIQMLDLQSGDEWAFDLLYCVAFEVMDAKWLATRASYMDFNVVLKSTRAQLERELLMEEITCIEDMPSYGLLCQ